MLKEAHNTKEKLRWSAHEAYKHNKFISVVYLIMAKPSVH